MDLTIEQALLQGIAAQEEGNFQDAESLYRAILQVQPDHPDANHNLGVLFVSTGKLLEAIPLFKLALRANPRVEQTWLSYIDALIQLGHHDEAERILVEGGKSGLSPEKLHVLARQVRAAAPPSARKTKQPPKLSEKRKRLAEKKKTRKRKAQGNVSGVEPSQDQINCLLENYSAGRLAKAEELALSLCRHFPTHPLAWKVLGALLNQSGKLIESLTAMEKSVELSPNDAETHGNLGATLLGLNRLDDAEISLRRAIALNPHLAEAHNNLGATLQELGRLDEAKESLSQAIVLQPDFAKAHNNLGNTLQKLGRLNESEASLRDAISLEPDYAEAHSNLATTLQKLGKLDDAAESYRRAVQLKPELGHAAHMLSALTGENTARAPLDYVENLFDHYAAEFDSSLVNQLDYQTPKVIAELITRNHESDNLGSILDLGCGTGLFGIEVSRVCDQIEGLDISGKMLQVAKERGIYHQLVKQDIESYLLTEPLNFDYFVATDVFVYIGELADVFEAIQSRNKLSGRLVFSVEHKDGDSFALLPSGRYAHSKPYIEGLCKRFQYRLEHFETQNLRLDKGTYILGGMYILSF